LDGGLENQLSAYTLAFCSEEEEREMIIWIFWKIKNRQLFKKKNKKILEKKLEEQRNYKRRRMYNKIYKKCKYIMKYI
jgi:hypothetical protein